MDSDLDSVFKIVEADRTRVVEVFQNAVSSSSPIPEIAPKALVEAITSQKPLSLNTEENNLLENGLRILLMNIIEKSVNHNNAFTQSKKENDINNIKQDIIKLLDIVLYLCEHGYAEPGIIFVLLEDLTEYSTISDCEKIFSYIESKQEVLGKAELLGRGKLVLLRACNQLLRRLSKSNHVILCGRILMFLAHFFPISERSAANIKGAYNLSNKTQFLKSLPTEGEVFDFSFYRTFWSLQEYFNNPPSVLSSPKWKQFSEDLKVVLGVFENQSIEDASSSSSPSPSPSSPSSPSSPLPLHTHTNIQSTFNTKFLTNPTLLSLQLKDKSFRQHILLQCLILFDFLKSPVKPEKEEQKEAIKDEVTNFEIHIKILLKTMMNEGGKFVERIEHVLEREKNWVLWKQKGCAPFEKNSVDLSFSEDNAPKRRKFYMGNEHLDRLSKIASSCPKLNDSKRIKVISFREYFQPLAEDMDPESGIEDAYSHKHDKLYCWRGLRLAVKNDFDAFTRFNDFSIEGVVPPDMLSKSVRDKMYGKQNNAAAAPAPAPAPAPSSAPAPAPASATTASNNTAAALNAVAASKSSAGNTKSSPAQNDNLIKLNKSTDDSLSKGKGSSNDLTPMDIDEKVKSNQENQESQSNSDVEAQKVASEPNLKNEKIGLEKAMFQSHSQSGSVHSEPNLDSENSEPIIKPVTNISALNLESEKLSNSNSKSKSNFESFVSSVVQNHQIGLDDDKEKEFKGFDLNMDPIDGTNN